jgi:hypothetical protein
MRLFELDQEKATVARIVALTNQLKQDLDKGKIDAENFSTDKLLNYFRKNDIILDRDDLYSMVKQRPLKGVVTNIQGDKVVFKGTTDSGSTEPDENKKTISKMAKHALNKK